MAISLVSHEETAKRLAQLVDVAADALETLAEIVRAEVHARGHAPRAVVTSRLVRLLAPAVAVDEQRLGEVCDALEREGDIVLVPGGVLYATPLRVVPIGERARVFGSMPTRALAAVLGRDVDAAGATRKIATQGDIVGAVASLGGALVPPEVWAGLDRTPHADAAFIATLDQRLEWEPSSAGSLDNDSDLEWRAWEEGGELPRWRRSDKGRLWWARTRSGGHHRAWTAGASPTRSAFVELSADDADRARFALSRQSGTPAVLVVRRDGKRAIIEVPAWLPRPEYRWLSLHAAPEPESKGVRWQVAAEDEALITRPLTERLGLVAEVR